MDEYIPVLEKHYATFGSFCFGYYTCEDADRVRQWKANLCFYPYNETIEIDVEMTDTPETGIPSTGSGYVALPGTRDGETTAKVYQVQLGYANRTVRADEIVEIIIPDESSVVHSLYQHTPTVSGLDDYYFIWQNAEDALYGFTSATSKYHVFEPSVKQIVPADPMVLAVAKDGRTLFWINLEDHQLRMIEIYTCDDGEEIVDVMCSSIYVGSIYMLMDTADGLQV